MPIILTLTPLQAKGLYALASEGAEGLLNDEEAGKAYVGNARAIKAAIEALDMLSNAVHRKK